MEIDYEVAWHALKGVIVEKPSHGQRDLLAEMGRLEVEHAVPAGAASLPPRPTHNGHSTTARRRVGAQG